MSTITKERAQQIFLGNGPEPTASEERELARIALASLEAEPVACPKCNDTGMADSGGVQPWGEPISVPCDCAAPPAPVSVPDERYQQLSELYHAQEKRLFKLAQRIKGQSFDKYAHSPSQAIDVLESAIFGEREEDCRAAMLQGANVSHTHEGKNHPEDKLGMVNHLGDANEKVNSPVTPDGWISCSDRMPEMGERQCYVLAADFKNNYPPSIPNTQVGVYGDWFNDGNPTWDDGDGEDLYLKEVTHWMPLPEPPQEVK